MKNTIKTMCLNRTLPKQGLISNRGENMRKLTLIMVMVALMLWAPILAEAKKEKKGHGHKKHTEQMQKDIAANASSIVDLNGAIDDTNEDVTGLQEQIDVHISNDSIHGGEGASGSYYTISEDHTIIAGEPYNISFRAVCGEGDQVISGGYRYGEPAYAPVIHVVGSGPITNDGGWDVEVFQTLRYDMTLTVIAVCFGENEPQ
ncbi:hypothetical protein ACFL0M_04790 [Thermodesulfobacteriota bacterium]